jgi:hypothetical protein
VNDRIVETGVFIKQVNDASQIETSTSKHAIEIRVESAIIADNALQLTRVKTPIHAVFVYFSNTSTGLRPKESKNSPRGREST